MHKFGMVGVLFCASISMAACSDPDSQELPDELEETAGFTPAEEGALVEQDDRSAEPVQQEFSQEQPDQTVIEMEPEIDPAAPMDSTMPMADDFGDEATSGLEGAT